MGSWVWVLDETAHCSADVACSPCVNTSNANSTTSMNEEEERRRKRQRYVNDEAAESDGEDSE